MSLDGIGRRMWNCPECKLFDNDTFPWHQFPPGHMVRIFTDYNGNTMNIGGITIRLSSTFTPCEKHQAEIDAAEAEEDKADNV